MTSKIVLDVDALYEALGRAVFYGARASQLWRYTREIVDMLYPAADYPDVDDLGRALVAEALIRRAVAAIGGISADALGILLCLSPGVMGRPASARQRLAAGLFDRHPRAFRRGRYQRDLLYDLAVEIYRIHSDTANPPTVGA
jgi:hypothetical protein